MNVGELGNGANNTRFQFFKDDKGLYVNDENDGVLDDHFTYLHEKYKAEGRFGLGGAAVLLADGREEGRRFKPFIYSGKWMASIKDFAKLMKEEMQRVQSLKTEAGWVSGKRPEAFNSVQTRPGIYSKRHWTRASAAV